MSSDDIYEGLAEVDFEPFELSLHGFGHFPPRGEPMVLWAGVTPESSITPIRCRDAIVLPLAEKCSVKRASRVTASEHASPHRGRPGFIRRSPWPTATSLVSIIRGCEKCALSADQGYAAGARGRVSFSRADRSVGQS